MKQSRYFLVLFMISLLLLLPIMTPTVEERLFPFQSKYVTMNIKAPQIQVESNVLVDITLNISYFVAEDQKILSIFNTTISQTTTIDLPERGVYILEFFSVVIADVTINQIGLPIIFPIIVILLGLINLGIFIYERYFSYFSY